MIEIDVIEIEPGIFAVAGAGQYQAHDPDLEGFAPMDEARANEIAENMRLLLASLFAS